MIDWLEAQGLGERKINYKLRDWLFSRQRYWGEPFPVIFVDDEPKAVDDTDLPVELPELDRYEPSGTAEGPLANAGDWLRTVDGATGRPARRETNTMPQWAGSCWYFLRYIDPENEEAPVDRELESYWMPVDLYVGGAEHAVLHLLYSRFWHKVLHDAGVVSTPEPFARLVHQGMILGELEYTRFDDEAGRPVSAKFVRGGRDTRSGAAVQRATVDEGDVVKQGEHFVLRGDPDIRVDSRAHKMSKSRGNVVNPDEILDRYGADAFRLYEMFMGPLEQVKPWNTRGVEGTYRFLNRVWRMLTDSHNGSGLKDTVRDCEPSDEQSRTLHRTIAKVTEDIEGLRFNTAIAALMEFTNTAIRWETLPRDVARQFTLILAPLAPHLAEELWQRLGHDASLAYAAWPKAQEEFLRTDTVEVSVQVNGKMRGRVAVPVEATEAQALAIARDDENVARHIAGKAIRRSIYVPGRIVNFVV